MNIPKFVLPATIPGTGTGPTFPPTGQPTARTIPGTGTGPTFPTTGQPKAPLTEMESTLFAKDNRSEAEKKAADSWNHNASQSQERSETSQEQSTRLENERIRQDAADKKKKS